MNWSTWILRRQQGGKGSWFVSQSDRAFSKTAEVRLVEQKIAEELQSKVETLEAEVARLKEVESKYEGLCK